MQYTEDGKVLINTLFVIGRMKTMASNKRLSISIAYVIAILVIGFKLTSWCSAEKAPCIATPKKKVVWLNVFVHGIMSIKPHLSWSNFVLFMKDKVEGTLYEKTVELMREDPFFYKNQAMYQLGFHAIDPSLTEGNSCASLAFIMNKIGHHYDVTPHENKYYTFGWSGLLSAKNRYRESKKLFKKLSKEVEQLKAEGYAPRVRIFGYSHGGNVSLNLAKVKQKEYQKSTLSIDELVLLGSPIIRDTDYLINDPLFKEVYNLYSLRDRVQPLDIFAPKQTISKRLFRPRKDFTLPDKLVQIQLKVTRCKRGACKDPIKFEKSKDYSKRKIVYGKGGLLRDISPGHMELWFFGWTPVHYRPNFPLNPLPTVAFAPPIMYHARKIAQSIQPERSIVADIRPEHNVILFRRQGHHSIHSTVPFLSEAKLKELHDSIYSCKPKLYDQRIYDEHIKDAVGSAREALSISRSTE